jgi:hypothetical protein
MYQHRQIGYSALIISAVVWIAVSVVDLAASLIALFIVSTAIIFVVATVFSTMTIAVTDDCVEWNLSFGLFKQRMSRTSIRSSAIIGISLLNGIGIRTNNFRDFLWCVGGSSAVRFELENGRFLSLGTDDPNGLMHALNARH